MTEQDRVDLFERWSETYDRSVLDESGLHEGYDEVLETVVRLADARPGMRVLDLGIGTGNLAQRFVSLGCAVCGVDFSPAMLAKARAKLPEVTLVQADLRKEWPTDGISALAGPYDRIVSTYVLHEFSLDHKVSLIRYLADHCLAPEGKIVIGDVAFDSVQARTDAGADHWDEEEHYWAADETRAVCRPAELRFTYTQVSRCGGVYVFTPATGEQVDHRTAD
jgi:cyclopropane fatty-acyl-phospholipid synthase-like methyltransferase